VVRKTLFSRSWRHITSTQRETRFLSVRAAALLTAVMFFTVGLFLLTLDSWVRLACIPFMLWAGMTTWYALLSR